MRMSFQSCTFQWKHPISLALARFRSIFSHLAHGPALSLLFTLCFKLSRRLVRLYLSLSSVRPPRTRGEICYPTLEIVIPRTHAASHFLLQRGSCLFFLLLLLSTLPPRLSLCIQQVNFRPERDFPPSNFTESRAPPTLFVRARVYMCIYIHIPAEEEGTVCRRIFLARAGSFIY